jgi:hypothetical protein
MIENIATIVLLIGLGILITVAVFVCVICAGMQKD